MKSIVILIGYFGSWPKWFSVFLESCRYNPTVNWVIRTDCAIPDSFPINVKFVSVGYYEYVDSVSKFLGINFNPSSSYKICDIRPAWGDMHYDEIQSYDFYGFGDLDVIYGDIRSFYSDEVLSFDVISTHEGMLSGHLSLFRNTEELRRSYRLIPGWKGYLELPGSTRFDEDIYSCLFFNNDETDIASFHNVSIFAKEQYTTVFHPMTWHDGWAQHPDIWFWRRGKITNSRNSRRHYLYLHLMNFQSMRWTNAEIRAAHVPWKDNPDVGFASVVDGERGVQIDWSGIHVL